jgi:hypothetical protein
MMARDRDVRNALMDLIRSTGQFDEVLTGRNPKELATPTAVASAHVDPFDFKQDARWDSGGLDGLEVRARCKVTFTVRDKDPEARDATLEKLFNAAQDVANDVSLADLTMPAFSRFHQGRWLPAAAPERQLEALYEYRYISDSSQAFDTSE